MTGGEAPSDAELKENLHRRMFIPSHDPTRPGLQKRYNQQTHKLTGNETWTVLNPSLSAGQAAPSVNVAAVATNVAATTTTKGFSPDALAAQRQGGLFAAKPPTTANTLGLDIEYINPSTD